MQKLEKILEDIQDVGNIQFTSYTKPLIAVEDVIKIIRKNMSGKDIDVHTKCSECSRRKWYQKGYEGGKKNDGWIPVERELPPNAKRKGDFCPKYRVMTKFGETYGWYNPDVKSWYVLIWFMTDRYLANEIDFDRGDKAKIVRLPDEANNVEHILIAWKSIEPYRPERSDPYDGKENQTQNRKT